MFWSKKKEIALGYIPADFFKQIELDLQPFLGQFGFKPTRDQKEERWYAARFFRSGSRYVVVEIHAHWKDAPAYGNVVFGVDSDEYPDRDYNSIALWRIAERHGAESAATHRVEGWTPKQFFDAVLPDLARYGRPFLEGDLQEFLALRAEQNRNRDPVRVYGPDTKQQLVTELLEQDKVLRERYSKPE